MICYRITKYNPKYRNSEGAYTKKEWTAYSDIGVKYDESEFTFKEYLETEDKYVNAITCLANFLNVRFFTIKNLEKHNKPKQDHFYSLQMVKIYDHAKNNLKIETKDALIIARLCLRENMWCRLESETMFVHFGYDYYMYIGSQRVSVEVMRSIEKNGLFVEEYTSPYSPDSPVEEE